MMLNGMRVFVHAPRPGLVRRTWWDRWFTRPWRPLERERLVVDEPLIGPNDCFVINGDLHVGTRAWHAMKDRGEVMHDKVVEDYAAEFKRRYT